MLLTTAALTCLQHSRNHIKVLYPDPEEPLTNFLIAAPSLHDCTLFQSRYGACTVTLQAAFISSRRGVKWCIHNHYQRQLRPSAVRQSPPVKLKRHGKTGNERGRVRDWISERVTGKGGEEIVNQ